MNFFNILSFFTFIFLTHGLYEDQAGKFDWNQQYIGKVDQFYIEKHNAPTRRIILNSNKNVHSALNLISGNIEWRQHLNEDETVMSVDYCKNHLVAVSTKSSSTILRIWDTIIGVLLSEIQLSETEATSSSIKCRFDEDSVMVLTDETVHSFRLKTGGSNWSQKLTDTNAQSIKSSSLYFLKSSEIVFTPVKVSGGYRFYRFNQSGTSLELPALDVLDDKTRCEMSLISDVFYCLDVTRNKLIHINLASRHPTWISYDINLSAIISSSRIINSIEIPATDNLIVSTMDQTNDDNPISAYIFHLPNSDDHNKNECNFLYKVENRRIVLLKELDSQYYLISLTSHRDKDQFNTEIQFLDLADGSELKYLRSQYYIARHHGTADKMDLLLFRKKDNNIAYRLFFVTKDDALHFWSQNGNQIWMREEALANVAAVEMLDLPVSDTEAKMDEEFGHNKDNIAQKFVKRISTQLKQLKHFLGEQLRQSKSAKYYSRPQEHSCYKSEYECRGEEDSQGFSSEPSSASNSEGSNNGTDAQFNIASTLRRDSFNVHKMLVLATTSGKLFGMESSTGRIVWRYLINGAEPFSGNRIQLFILRTTAHFPHPPEAVLIMKNTKSDQPILYTFNPITGLPRGPMRFLPFRMFLATMLSLPVSEENSYSRPVLILDRDLKVHIYPPSFKLSLRENPIYIYRVDDRTGSVLGYEVKLHSPDACLPQQQQQLDETECYVAHELWRLAFSANSQKISAVAFKSPIEQVHSVGRILSDRNVLYKYLNPNLLAVSTESTTANPEAVVTIYLVDVVTGKIIYSTVHRKASGPINLIQSENWIVYSYQNLKSHRTEMVVLELYEPYDVPESVLSEIKDVDVSQLRRDRQGNQQQSAGSDGGGFDILSILSGERATTRQFSSRQRSRIDTAQDSAVAAPIVLKQAYIFGTFVRRSAVSITEKGITAKSVLLALETGGVLELPKALLDPRRSLMMSQELLEEGIEPYMPEIPVRTFSIINYNRSIARTRNIYAGPSGLESTSLVFVYGLDLFFTQIAPSKMYDVLKEDFDYVFIGTVTVSMIVGAFVTQRLAARKALYRAWQ